MSIDEQTPQQQLVEEKAASLQVVLREVGLTELVLNHEIEHQYLGLVFEVNRMRDGDLSISLSLTSRESYLDFRAVIGVCYDTRERVWSYFECLNSDDCTAVDLKRLSSIVKLLKLPETDHNNIAESSALEYARRLATHYKMIADARDS